MSGGALRTEPSSSLSCSTRSTSQAAVPCWTQGTLTSHSIELEKRLQVQMHAYQLRLPLYPSKLGRMRTPQQNMDHERNSGGRHACPTVFLIFREPLTCGGRFTGGIQLSHTRDMAVLPTQPVVQLLHAGNEKALPVMSRADCQDTIFLRASLPRRACDWCSRDRCRPEHGARHRNESKRCCGSERVPAGRTKSLACMSAKDTIQGRKSGAHTM